MLHSKRGMEPLHPDAAAGFNLLESNLSLKLKIFSFVLEEFDWLPIIMICLKE